MAGNLKLTVGLAAGYVVGARAGRERYEQLVEAARQAADRLEVQQLAGKVRSSLGAGLEKATDAAGDRLEQARSRMEPAGDAEDTRSLEEPRSLDEPAGSTEAWRERTRVRR